MRLWQLEVSAVAALLLLIRAAAAPSYWIMANTRFPVPTCPARCLAAQRDERKNVGFEACESGRATQEWVYTNESRVIRLASKPGLCLEPVFKQSVLPHIRLANCSGEHIQRWSVDVDAAAISSELSPTMYLASVALGYDAVLVYANGNTGNRIMSMVPVGLPLSSSFSMVDARTRAAGNLVVNGNFELSNYEVDAAAGSSISLRPGNMFGACAWDMSLAEAELVRQDDQLSMHLIKGSITQSFQASTSGYYVLSFLLCSNCKEQQQQEEVVVLIEPSNLRTVVAKAEKGASWSTRTYVFQARAASVDLTFQRIQLEGCSLLIDDVRVLAYNGATGLIAASSSSTKRTKQLSSSAMAGVIAGASLAAFLAGALCMAIIIFSSFLRSSSKSPDDSRPMSSHANTQSSLGLGVPDIGGARRVPTFAGVRILSFGQVERATLGFSTVLGKGSLGYVYLAQSDEGTRGAAKRIFKMFHLTEMDFFDMVRLLGRMVHPNIVKLLAFSRDHGEQILIFEYIPGGNLYQRLHGFQDSFLPWNVRLKVALDVATALEYLHHVAAPRVVHRRVKSANIYISKEGKAKLGSGGSDALCNRHHQHDDGYMDPSAWRSGTTDKSDVYSFGVLLLELVTGMRPCQDGVLLVERMQDLLAAGDSKLLLDNRLQQQRGLDSVAQIIKACIQEEQEDRPSMAEVVELLRQRVVLDTQSEATPEARTRPNSPVTPRA